MCNLTLRGLVPEKTYRVQISAGFGKARAAAGKELMERGLELVFPHKGAGAIVTIEPVK
jgi:hypothetical protein